MTLTRLSALAFVVVIGACTSQQEREQEEKERAAIAARAAKVEAEARTAQAKADTAQQTAAEAKAAAQQNDAKVGEPGPGAAPTQAAQAPAAPGAQAASSPAPKCDCPPPPPPPPPAPPYKLGGEFAVGFQTTSGNSSTEALNAKLSLGWQWERWKDAFEAAGLESKSNGVRSAQRYSVGDKLNRDVFEKDFVFGQVEYDNDHFGAYRERMSETGGYGHHVLSRPNQTLDVDIGAGARQEITNEPPGCSTVPPTVTTGCFRTRSTDFIGRGDIKYEWKLTEKTTLGETAKYERGRLDTFEESVTELKMPVYANIAAVVSYTARHHTNAPAGAAATDTMTSVGLTYAFGTKP